MRNILITVMMLIVVALLFTNIIAKESTGTKARIETQGSTANEKIAGLSP